MEIEEKLMENDGKLRMLEMRLKALENALGKEGIITSEDVDEELKEVLKIKEDEEE